MFLIYDKNGYATISGEDTCKLMMETFVENLKAKNFSYNSYDTEKTPSVGFKENMRREVGNNYASESITSDFNLNNNL